MKRRYVLISDKQPNWKKEFYWKSLLKQIQDELPVKDVAQMVVDYLVFDQKILICSKDGSEAVNLLDGTISSKPFFGMAFSNAKTVNLQESNFIVIEIDHSLFIRSVEYKFGPDQYRYGLKYIHGKHPKRLISYNHSENKIAIVCFDKDQLRVQLYSFSSFQSTFHDQWFIKYAYPYTKDTQLVSIGNTIVLINETGLVQAWVKKSYPHGPIDIFPILSQQLKTSDVPLIINEAIICSSSPGKYDTVYWLQTSNFKLLMTQEGIEMAVFKMVVTEDKTKTFPRSYRYTTKNIYRLEFDEKNVFSCEEMQFQDEEIDFEKEDTQIHSLQETLCGVFIIGIFQRDAKCLTLEYRCYRSDGLILWKTEDKQHLFHSKVTHSLLFN